MSSGVCLSEDWLPGHVQQCRGKGAVTKEDTEQSQGAQLGAVGNNLGRVRVQGRLSTLTPLYSMCLFLPMSQTNRNIASFFRC